MPHYLAYAPHLRRAWVRFGVAVAVAAALSLAMHAVGRGSRRVLPQRRVERVASGADTLQAWLRAGVRGRALLWVERTFPTEGVPDGRVHAFLDDPSAGVVGAEEGFAYLAMRANVIRRVVFPVPDDRWELFVRNSRDRPDLVPRGRGFVMVTDGMPVLAVAARDIPAATGEPMLVYLGPSARGSFGDAFVDRLLAGGEGADLVLERR